MRYCSIIALFWPKNLKSKKRTIRNKLCTLPRQGGGWGWGVARVGLVEGQAVAE